MITAVDIAQATGPALLETVVCGSPQAVVEIAFSEPEENLAPQRGDLLLGAGLVTVGQAEDLLNSAAASGAAGVVLKSALADHPKVGDMALELDVPLLKLQRSVSWAHLVLLLRGVLDRDAAPGSPATGDAGVHGDLFALADAAAKILGAPVTIEDAGSRVLAHSVQQDRTDQARISTIVGRRVPEKVLSHFRARGVFRQLLRSDEPIFVPAGLGGILARLIVPVRAGGELLGSIWAVVEEPVAPDRVAELRSASRLLALHLLRLRAQADLARLVAGEQLRGVLRLFEAGAEPPSWLPRGPWRVVALTRPDESGGDVHHDIDIWVSIMRRHGWREPLVTDLDGGIFTVVSDSTQDNARTRTPAGTWHWLRHLVHELHGDDFAVCAAAGSAARAVTGLATSRAEATEVSELMGRGKLLGIAPTFEDSWAHIVTRRATLALPAVHELGGPLAALLQHDAMHGTSHVTTLTAYLSHITNLRGAAVKLHIHPNTLRYRMQRIQAISPFQLDCPTVQFALRLQLEALPE